MKIWKTTLHISYCIGKVIAEPEMRLVHLAGCDCIKGYKSSDWQAIMCTSSVSSTYFHHKLFEPFRVHTFIQNKTIHIREEMHFALALTSSRLITQINMAVNTECVK